MVLFLCRNKSSRNGTEFKNANVDTILDEEGISHEFSATYTPQKNGVVVRKNQTLIEMPRTFDEIVCDALIANGGVKNRQERCKTFAMAEPSNMVQILVACAMQGTRLIHSNGLR